MDLGMFKSGKAGFASWLAYPAAFILVIYLPGTFYANHLMKTCAGRMAVVQYMPELNRESQRAMVTLKRLTPLWDGEGDRGAELSLRIQKIAQAHGLVIRTLTPDVGVSPGKTGRLPYITVTIQGEGTILALVRMLDDLQRPEYLCRIETMRTKVSTWVPEQVYSSDIVLRCYGLSTFGGGG